MTHEDLIYYDKDGNVIARSSTGSGKIERISAYLFIAIGAIFGVWFIGHNISEDLKSQINDFAVVSCLEQRKPDSATFKYNDFLDDQIGINIEAKRENLIRQDFERAAINEKAIIKYEKDKLKIPTIEQCNIPVLR